MVHWIEESTLAKWELKSGLIGFMWLNNAHNGESLSQALFKVIKQVRIEKHVSVILMDVPSNLLFAIKVGHITCDNASNNSTMMKELAMRLKISTGKKYYWRKRKIKYVGFLTWAFQLLMSDSCLAHVINLLQILT